MLAANGALPCRAKLVKNSDRLDQIHSEVRCALHMLLKRRLRQMPECISSLLKAKRVTTVKCAVPLTIRTSLADTVHAMVV